MTESLLKGKRFYCREWAFTKLLHCLETRASSKTCGTLVMGGPGSGKTALGCELVWPSSPQGKQSSLNSRLLAYHFCQAHDASSLSVVSFINNLVTQACTCPHLPDFRSHLSATNAQHLLQPRECEGNADEAFKVSFLEPLHSCEPPPHALMLWVDSIDESYLHPVSERAGCSQTIAELLAAHNASLPPWLLLVCSARKQSKVVTRMFTGFRKLSLDDLRKSHVVRDVQQYILCRLDAEDGLRQHLSRDTAEMLNQLHIKSNGCFLYLEKVLDGVAESFIMLREVREIPGTLNGLYLWLCQRLFVKKHVVKIQPILNVLLAARSPVGGEELFRCLLMHETDLSREEFDRRLRLLGRVLMSGAGGEQIVFHHSFSEWLLDVKHCTQKYLCDAGQGHAMLALRQLQIAPQLDMWQVQDLALHLVRANFPEPMQFEHLTQMLVLSGARVDKCLTVGLPKEVKVLKLLTEAGARSPAMEASITSLDSLPDHPDVTGRGEEEGEGEEDVSGPVDKTDGNGRTRLHTASYRGDAASVDALLARGAALELLDRSGQTALTLAARQGHANIVTALVTAGACVDHADHEGWTALRSAAWAGHTKVVSLLLDKGAQVDHADGEQRTALRAACWGGHEDIVRLLLDHQADVNKTDHEGRTALIAAAYMGHVEIVEELLDQGAEIDHEDCDGRTALSVACLCVPASEGHERVVSLLLERGAEVDHTDKDGSTPLLVAAYEGHPGVCDMLLEWDADADHSDVKHRTPLWAAASMGHQRVVRQLLFWGAAVDHIDTEGRTVLCVAAAQGSQSVVRQLLDRGLDEMHRDNSGWTPLHLAAYEGHQQICVMLLEQGAKPNEVDNDGRIALIQAAQEGHVGVVQSLLAAGSQVNHRSHDGKTALRVAAVEGHTQVLELLLSAGADMNYKDADGRTTLYVIALDGSREMTDLLLSRGAELEAVDVEGRTALHVASWQGNLDVVRALVTHGAKVNSVDNDRRTAVQSASWQGHECVVKLLLEAGARVDHTCNQGATALCIAAQEGHEDVVRTLLSYQANPNHADQFGRTPYRVALKSGHLNVCKILEDFGAMVPNGAKSRSNSSTSSGEIKMNTPGSTTQGTTGQGSTTQGSSTHGTTAGSSHTSSYLHNIELTTVIVQPPPSTTSPESSFDRRKSYHSNNSSKSSSNMTSSTNPSIHSGQMSGLSRLDRECLTFTQQLQQCSMGKNRSRPISRVLSPVSEPQSPVHSPCTTPVRDATHSTTTTTTTTTGGSSSNNNNNKNKNRSTGAPSRQTSSDPHHTPTSASVTSDHNLMSTSPVKWGSSKQERISATINIITNPHADMMSSVEEPVWQRNPAHPNAAHTTTTTTSGQHHHHNLSNFPSTTTTSSSSSSSSTTGSHPHQSLPSPSADSPARIMMGRASLGKLSPDMRRKRNGIVTNPKVSQNSAKNKLTSAAPTAPTAPTQYNRLSQQTAGAGEPCDNPTKASPSNGYNNILPGDVSDDVEALLAQHLDLQAGGGGSVFANDVYAVSAGSGFKSNGQADQGHHGDLKAVRPNGLPIKKVNSPNYH